MSINNSVAKLWKFFHNISIELKFSVVCLFPSPGQNRFSWDPESSNVCAETMDVAETAKNPNISKFGRALFCLRPEELAGMFLFRFSAILRWPAKVKQLSRVPTKTFKDQNCVFYKKKDFKKYFGNFARKNHSNIILLCFWHHSRFISDVWDLCKLNQVSSKVQIHQNSNRCAKINLTKNESESYQSNILQFQKVHTRSYHQVHTPYHTSFVSNDEVGYPKTQYPRWNNLKNQTQPDEATPGPTRNLTAKLEIVYLYDC